MGVFTFSFPPQNHNPSNKDLSSLLSYIKTILTKDFITLRASNPNIIIHLKKKTKERSGGEGKGSTIPEPNTRQNTSLKIGHITNYFKPKEKKKKKKKS